MKSSRRTFRSSARLANADWQPKRRGAISLQVILLIPLLLIATISVVQYGMQVVARQTVQAAATAGARTAARGNKSEDVTKAIAHVLAADKIPVHQNGQVVIVQEHFGKEPIITGNISIPCKPNGPNLREGEVRVTVCVLAGSKGSSRIPNWLGALGRPLSPKHIQASSLVFFE
ncbi:MAG: hypothetical protein Tsb009_27640 [Planctomycetaceae bacterium]